MDCYFAKPENPNPNGELVATWSASGGNIAPSPSLKPLFAANCSAGSAKVTGTYRGASLNVDFSVVAPSAITVAKRGADDAFGSGHLGAGRHFDVILLPTTVSFCNLLVTEPIVEPTGVDGWFRDNPPGTHDSSKGQGTWPVASNNKITDAQGVFDHASSKVPDSAYGYWGTYTWPLHNTLWTCVGSSSPGTQVPGWTDQKVTLDANGTVTVEKFGNAVIRPRNAP